MSQEPSLPAEEGPERSYQDDFAPSQMGSVIDHLVDLVANAKSLPMTSTVLVNRTEIVELLESAREALPEDVAKADGIISEADEVLARARFEAQTALSQATEMAEETRSAAEQEAEELVAQAQADAEEIVAKAEAAAEALDREATKRAEALTTKAHQRAEDLISNEHVMQEAKLRGRELYRKAEHEAQQRKRGADEYCETQLEELETLLHRMQQQTRTGRQELADRAANMRREGN